MTWIAVETKLDFNRRATRKRVYFDTKEEACNYAEQQRKHAKKHIEVYEEENENNTNN